MFEKEKTKLAGHITEARKYFAMASCDDGGMMDLDVFCGLNRKRAYPDM